MSPDYGRGMRMDMNRRGQRSEAPAPPAEKEAPPPTSAPVAPVRADTDDDKPIPDDLSEISDDPDDILNREDVSIYNYILVIRESSDLSRKKRKSKALSEKHRCSFTETCVTLISHMQCLSCTSLISSLPFLFLEFNNFYIKMV